MALVREMAERQRLEEEILQISEREQRRIGHDLHDSLCQHLTATALAGQVLGERLAAKSLPEAADAAKVVELVEEGITLARNLARGLYPVQMEAEGLMAAFEDLAANITRGARVRCVFERDAPVLMHDDAAATHLYRIAQEAVRNAIQHGKPKRIGIALSERNGQVTLTVEDDGVGVPDTCERAGLGIRIMAHRAAMIGGSFAIEPAPTGGTIVTCSFPKPPPRTATHPPMHHDCSPTQDRLPRGRPSAGAGMVDQSHQSAARSAGLRRGRERGAGPGAHPGAQARCRHRGHLVKGFLGHRADQRPETELPGVAVLVLSMHEESHYAERALRAGARGYLMKRETTRKVIAAIRQVLEGRLCVSEAMAAAMAAQFVAGKTLSTHSPIEQLSDRELEVFEWLGQGRGTRQVAETLRVSVKTVQAYCARIKEKLNLPAPPSCSGKRSAGTKLPTNPEKSV